MRSIEDFENCIKVDWKEFIGQSDMIWEREPLTWYEGSFMGNGLLGALIYNDTQCNLLKLELGRSDVYDHRNDSCPGGMLYANSRLPIGHFLLKTEGRILEWNMRLDLWNAETRGKITTDKGEINFRALVHSDEMLIIFEIEATEGESGSKWDWNVAEAISPRYTFAVETGDKGRMVEGYKPNLIPKIENFNGINVCKQPFETGGETATAWKEIDYNKKKLLIISIANSWPEKNASQKAIEDANKVTALEYNLLIESHRNWWNDYYTKSFISIPDTKLENFYWIQMYKLACATRADRAVIDNQGPWLVTTAWPGTWWNLNVQLSYWPTYASNRFFLAESLLKALDKHSEDLINNVEEPYRYDSAGIATASTIGLVSPVKVPGRDKSGFVELGNLTWTLHDCWLHYRMTMDDEILKNIIYPLLRRAVNYYIHFLREDSEGILHLLPTSSPEYGVIVEDCNYDLSLLRWGCNTLIYSCERLNIEDDLISKWKHILKNLTQYPQSEKEGFMIGRDTAYEKSHRHFSHLLMIYPLYLVNIEQEGSREIIEKSLSHWQSKPEELQGYSCTGASSISAAIGNGDDALKYLNGLWGGFLRPNTLYKESGPVIETPLSGAQCIHDMLLQSFEGKIRVFPAVPQHWNDVAFHDMRAEGAFLISAARKDGKTSFIRIKSLAGEPCILKVDLNRPFECITDRVIQIDYIDNYCKLDIKRDEEIIIVYTDKTSTIEIKSCIPEMDLINCYGLNSKTGKAFT